MQILKYASIAYLTLQLKKLLLNWFVRLSIFRVYYFNLFKNISLFAWLCMCGVCGAFFATKEKLILEFYLLFICTLYFSEEMMGNLELAPELEVNFLQPLLSQDVVNELLSTYMSTLTVIYSSNFNAIHLDNWATYRQKEKQCI